VNAADKSNGLTCFTLAVSAVFVVAISTPRSEKRIKEHKSSVIMIDISLIKYAPVSESDHLQIDGDGADSRSFYQDCCDT